MDNAVLEYLEGYFGGQLNESTSDEDIMEAFADLLETADAVEEFLNEDKAKGPNFRPRDPVKSSVKRKLKNLARGGKKNELRWLAIRAAAKRRGMKIP